jgi:hypothetical protein
VLVPFVRLEATVVAHSSNFSRKKRISSNYQSAFSGGDLFVGIEGEYGGVTECTYGPISVLRAERFTRIFDDSKMMALRNVENRIHIRGTTKGVHCDDGPSAGCNRSLDSIGVNIQVARLDINEHRNRALVPNRVRRGNKRE